MVSLEKVSGRCKCTFHFLTDCFGESELIIAWLTLRKAAAPRILDPPKRLGTCGGTTGPRCIRLEAAFRPVFATCVCIKGRRSGTLIGKGSEITDPVSFGSYGSGGRGSVCLDAA